MKYAPNGYPPGLTTILNKRPAWAKDPREVDRYLTYLAAARKWAVPVMIGTPLDVTNSTTPAPVEVIVPQYTQHVAFDYLCTGQGKIRATVTGDAFNAETWAYAYDSGTHAFANAITVSSGDPMPAPGADGYDRALNVAFESAPSSRKLTFRVFDDGLKTLKVWGIRVVFLPPMETAELPA